MFTTAKLVAVSASCAAVAALASGTAGATPPQGVTAETLLRGSVPGTDLTLRRIEIAPGGSTGWHYHDGFVSGVVASGTLTRTLQDCTVVVSSTGQIVIEDSGAGHVHQGVNRGTVPLVLLVTYAQPTGKPFAEDASAVACP